MIKEKGKEMRWLMRNKKDKKFYLLTTEKDEFRTSNKLHAGLRIVAVNTKRSGPIYEYKVSPIDESYIATISLEEALSQVSNIKFKDAYGLECIKW